MNLGQLDYKKKVVIHFDIGGLFNLDHGHLILENYINGDIWVLDNADEILFMIPCLNK